MNTLRRLIDAVPATTLREIIFEMLAAEPAKRRPPGRPAGFLLGVSPSPCALPQAKPPYAPRNLPSGPR